MLGIKKTISRVLVTLVFLCSIFSSGLVYANDGNTISSSVELVQDQSVIQLESLDSKVDMLLDKAQAGTSTDTAQDIRIEKKKQEIEVLINQAQEEIQDTSNKQEIKEIVAETEKTIELKQSSALTDYDTLKEGLKEQGIISKTEVTKAEQVLKDAILDTANITVQIKTTQSLEAVKTKLTPYDESLQASLLFNEDGLNYIEVEISNTSLLKQEVFTTIGQSELPDSVLGYEIIKPQVFKIDEVGTHFFASEQETSNLWGWKSFGLQGFQAGLSDKIGATKIKVGVIDTGIERYHPDLIGNVSTTLGYDFINDDNDANDDQGHGTHVAGTIGAIANSQGIIGVNPNVELVPLKICDMYGYCSNMAILNAIAYAKQNNIKLLNMSLGGRMSPVGNVICEAIEDFVGNGGIVVAAAGNSNVDTSTFVPGGCPYAITVGAIDSFGSRAYFSNYGTKVDVSAPGVGIYSSALNGGYKSMDGTSMATPHIAGLVSLMKVTNANLTASQIKQLFKQYTLPVTTDTAKPIANAVDVPALLNGMGVSGSIEFTSLSVGITGTIPATTNGIKINTPFIPDINTPIVGDMPVDRVNNYGFTVQSDVITPVSMEGLATIVYVNDEGLMIQERKILNKKSNGEPIYEGDIVPVSRTNTNFTRNTKVANTIVASTTLGPNFFNVNALKEGITDVNTYNNGIYRDTYDLRVIKKPPVGTIPIALSSIHMTLQQGNVGSITIGGGNGTINVSLSNSNVSKNYLGAGVYLFQGVSIGTTEVYFEDTQGQKVKAVIFVTPKTGPVKEITATLSANEVQIGSTVQLQITDGNGLYSVWENGTPYSQISQTNPNNDTTRTIKGLKPGVVTLYIKDSKEKSFVKQLIVKSEPVISAKELVLSAYSKNIFVDGSFELQVLDGNGSYSICNYAITHVSYTNISPGRRNIKGLKVGSSTLDICDGQNKRKSVTINTENIPSGAIKEIVIDPVSISMVSASTKLLSILDGNGGYRLEVNPNYLSISQVNGYVYIFNVTALKAGSTTITITDRHNKTKDIPVTIALGNNETRELQLSIGTNITVSSGESKDFQVVDGNGGYFHRNYNPALFTLVRKYIDNNLIRTIKGLQSGTGLFLITDDRAKRKYVDVIISGSISPIKELLVNTGALLLNSGSVNEFTVTDGNGNYVVSYDTSLLQVSKKTSSSDLIRLVKGLKVGNGTITVTDSKGKTKTISVSVTQSTGPTKELITNVSTLTINSGATSEFTILSGNGGYGVSYDTSLMLVSKKVSTSDLVWIVKGLKVGNSAITVSDSRGKSKTINVTTTALGVSPINVNTGIITIESGASAIIQILQGNGGYSVSYDVSLMKVVKSSTTDERVRKAQGLKIGNGTITITDSKGVTKVINVTITPKPVAIQTFAKITAITPINAIPEGGVGLLHFQITGLVVAVGIEYFDAKTPTVTYQKILQVNPNQSYYVYYNWKCIDGTWTCKMGLKPYVIDIAGNKVYFVNGTYSHTLTYYQGTMINSVGEGDELYGYEDEMVEYVDDTPLILPEVIPQEILDNADNVAIASVDGGVEIASATPGTLTPQFVVGLPNVGTIYTKNPGTVNGVINATEDQIQACQDLGKATVASQERMSNLYATRTINQNHTLDIGLDSIKTAQLGTYTKVTTAKPMMSQLSEYDKQQSDAYLAVNMGGLAGQGVAIATKAIDLIRRKVDSIEQKVGLLTKPTIIKQSHDLVKYTVGGIHFKISGIPKSQLMEVGVEFTNSLGQKERQGLVLQDDGEYMIAYSKATCLSCKEFKPYYIKQGGVFVSSIGDDYVQIGDDNLQSSLQIAQLTFDQYFTVLKNAWKWANYDSIAPIRQQKLVDVKDKYLGYASMAVSLYPGVGEAYDIATLIIGIDPITQDALSPFERKLTYIGLFSFVGSGPLARQLAGDVMTKLAPIALKYGLSIDEFTKVVEKVLDKLNINSFQDIVDNKENLKFDAIKTAVDKEAAIMKQAIASIKWSTVSKPDLTQIENEHLRRSLSNDYRNDAVIGNKSTADAIRYTKATGILVGNSDHIIKGNDILNGIRARFNANDLNAYDKKIATDIFNDITNAINGN